MIPKPYKPEALDPETCMKSVPWLQRHVDRGTRRRVQAAHGRGKELSQELSLRLGFRVAGFGFWALGPDGFIGIEFQFGLAA